MFHIVKRFDVMICDDVILENFIWLQKIDKTSYYGGWGLRIKKD